MMVDNTGFEGDEPQTDTNADFHNDLIPENELAMIREAWKDADDQTAPSDAILIRYCAGLLSAREADDLRRVVVRDLDLLQRLATTDEALTTLRGLPYREVIRIASSTSDSDSRMVGVATAWSGVLREIGREPEPARRPDLLRAFVAQWAAVFTPPAFAVARGESELHAPLVRTDMDDRVRCTLKFARIESGTLTVDAEIESVASPTMPLHDRPARLSLFIAGQEMEIAEAPISEGRVQWKVPVDESCLLPNDEEVPADALSVRLGPLPGRNESQVHRILATVRDVPDGPEIGKVRMTVSDIAAGVQFAIDPGSAPTLYEQAMFRLDLAVLGDWQRLGEWRVNEGVAIADRDIYSELGTTPGVLRAEIVLGW